MLEALHPLRELSLVSIIIRLVLAAVCGGLIGLERTFKGRPSGFRTHILICVGASITTMTSQYLLLYMNYYTDIARLGAQVVAGVGFIGAGTIMLTPRNRVKGLTTAAGLWASAIVGLACGIAYIEAAVYVTFLILIAEVCFSKLEQKILSSSREMSLYVELSKDRPLEDIIEFLKKAGIKINDMQVTRFSKASNKQVCVIFNLRTIEKKNPGKAFQELSSMEGVLAVVEL